MAKFYMPPPWMFGGYGDYPPMGYRRPHKDPFEQAMKFMRWQETKELSKKRKEEEEKKKKGPPPPAMSKAEALGFTLALTPFIGTVYMFCMAWGFKQTLDLLHSIR